MELINFDSFPTFTFTESSNILGISYNKELKELYVLFKNSKIYKYAGVGIFEYGKLIASNSKGRYLSNNIRGKYTATYEYEVKRYYVVEYTGCKLLITEIDENRKYIIVDSVKREIFNTNPGGDTVEPID